MILPIALKYDEYGVLQFVRCLYFDVDPKLCSGTYAIRAKYHSNTKYFYNNAVLVPDIVSNSRYGIRKDTACYVDNQPVTPDSQYSFIKNLPANAINLTSAKIIEIPAKEYLIKYGDVLKTSNIAVIDYKNQVNNPFLVQGIAPKITSYMVKNKAKPFSLEIHQRTFLRSDDCCLVDKKDFQDDVYLLNKDLQEAKLDYDTQLVQNCTIYIIDYTGKITKMSLSEALNSDMKIANFKLETRFMTSPSKISARGVCLEGYELCHINEFDLSLSAYNATEDLNMQAVMQGIRVRPSRNYEAMLNPNAISAIVPCAECITLALLDDYKLQNIRFGEMIGDLDFRTNRKLDTVILPKYLKECTVQIPSARVLQLPECCTGSFDIRLDDYYQSQIKLELRSDTDVTIKNAPELESIELYLNNSLDIVGASDNLYFKIRSAPKLKLLKLTQSDLCASEFLNVNIGIDRAGSYDVILDCNAPYIKLSTDNVNQVLNIYCTNTIEILGIYYMQGQPCKVNIHAARQGIVIKSVQLNERDRTYHSLFYPVKNGLLDKTNGLIEKHDRLAYLPQVTLEGFDYII